MIYLIKSSAYNKEGDHIDILKIGYTGDTNNCNRVMTYYYHNPTCILLYTIPNATELEEDRLHYKFRDYLFDSPNFSCTEWFYYNDEIVNYFKTHTTKESLLDLEEAPENRRSAFTKFKNEVYSAIDYVLSVKCQEGSIDYDIAKNQRDNLVNNIIYNRRIRTTEKLWEYIKDVFNLFPLEMQKLLDTNQLNKDSMVEVNNFLNKFRSILHFTDRMRLLCESSLSEEVLLTVLKQIPLEYSRYFITLGPERIKARCYKKGELEKEYSISKESSNGSIKETVILRNFIVGEKYSIRSIKEALKDLYIKNDIQSSPKAVDLLNYFEVMKTRVKDDSTGKFIDGYKILKKKDV